MAASEVSICNMALTKLGGSIIISLNDESNEAKLCKANYDSCRDAVLEERDWTFAVERKILPALSEAPSFYFSSASQLPSDCIRVLGVYKSGISRTPIEWSLEGRKILSNYAPLYVKYIKRVTDPNIMSPGFIKALAARLEWELCVPLTGNVNLANLKKANYYDLLATGGVFDAKQGVNVKLESSVLINARNRKGVIYNIP